MARERIYLLTIPLDILQPEELEGEIMTLLEKPGAKSIVLLSVWNLLFARMNKEYKICLEAADLILPVSKSLLSGASFLKLKTPVRYNPFSFIISVLGILESHYKSLYLFGTRKKSLLQAERNVRKTFPSLQVVGRYAGYYPKTVEADIVSAIYKASPSMVLLGNGISGNIRWPYRNRNSFSSSIFLWDYTVLDVFSKRKKKVSAETFDKGLEVWYEILLNPIKIFLFFPYIWYIILLVWYRLFKKENE